MSSNEEAEGRPLFSYRTLDIAVALFFLVVCAIVMTDSLRLGIAWKPNVGPQPGLFPFYIVLAMGIASLTQRTPAASFNSPNRSPPVSVFTPSTRSERWLQARISRSASMETRT